MNRNDASGRWPTCARASESAGAGHAELPAVVVKRLRAANYELRVNLARLLAARSFVRGTNERQPATQQRPFLLRKA
jgi:hypothetical protein